MSSPQLERLQAARATRDSGIIGGLIAYFLLIPLPLLLLGYFQWGCIATLLALIYLYLDPTFMTPIPTELGEVSPDSKAACAARTAPSSSQPGGEVIAVAPTVNAPIAVGPIAVGPTAVAPAAVESRQQMPAVHPYGVVGAQGVNTPATRGESSPSSNSFHQKIK